MVETLYVVVETLHVVVETLHVVELVRHSLEATPKLTSCDVYVPVTTKCEGGDLNPYALRR